MTSDKIIDAEFQIGRYRLPSQMSQIFTVYCLQMRLYAKSVTTYLFLILAALMPISVGVLEMLTTEELLVNAYEGLVLLPYMIALIPAVLVGRTLSSEFKNRTAYLTFPLPVTRTSFFTGKFLSAMTLCAGMILLGYGLAITLGGMYDAELPGGASSSLCLCLLGTFAITAMAYALSAFFRRGSAAVTIFVVIVIPVIVVAVLAIVTVFTGMTEAQADRIVDVMTATPMYTGQTSLSLIDPNGSPLTYGTYVYASVSVIWGALFLLLGWIKMNRKEL